MGGAAGADLLALLHGKVAEFEQPVHEQAQALLGRQAAGAGVGRVEQPRLLQIGHHVADRGRRQVERQAARQRAAADRLAGLHIDLDQLAQHRCGAGIKRAGGEGGQQARGEGRVHAPTKLG
jgi:hypothetical protein